MWLSIIDIINTRFIYYKGGLILYRKIVSEDKIVLLVRVIYLIGIEQNIVSDEQYELSKNITLKAIICTYKKIIDDFNLISKK